MSSVVRLIASKVAHNRLWVVESMSCSPVDSVLWLPQTASPSSGEILKFLNLLIARSPENPMETLASSDGRRQFQGDTQRVSFNCLI